VDVNLNPSNPVNRLNRSEFAEALRKGQGRAMLHVIHFGLDEVKDLVLEACLHNQVYDQQIESGRGNWLFDMFRGTSHYPEFHKAILNVMETETDFWDLYQLCQLIRQIAGLGDEETHQRLRDFVYRNAADVTSEYDWLGIEDLLSLEDAEGILTLARILGKRLIADPDDFVDDSLLYSESYPEYAKILAEHSQEDAAIGAYREYLEKRNELFSSTTPLDKETRKQQYHERVRRDYSLQTILDDASKESGEYPGHYMTFGKHATPEELEKIYACLLSEPNNPTRIRLLWVFRRAKLPRIDTIALDWAHSDNAELRAASLAALSQISDPRIHQLARMKAETGQLLGADEDALELFILNYENGDELLIENSLDHLQPTPEDAHSLGYSILKLADQHKDRALADLLNWVYENTPCANCRSRAIVWLDQFHQFSDALRFECEYDADEDVRDMAHRITERIKSQ
jgi:hypothetical protein